MKLLLTCCKYVLFGAALIPFLAVAFVTFPMLSWSWRIGVFLPLIVLALWGLLTAIKALFARAGNRQSPELVEQQDGEHAAAPKAREDRLKELQETWKSGIDTLKGSHLKQEGDPLYVLPWYLVLGESGSGKSAALQSARLATPFAGKERPPGATPNCAWLFCDNAVLIDTAGRYAAPVDAGGDNAEWMRLLSLLARYRSHDPINGLILTLPADKLSGEEPHELEAYGRQLRCRIDEMSRHLGISFPVYLLITKCDLIGGMTRFCAGLPERSLDQPMGLANEDAAGDPLLFLERFRKSIDHGLRRLRLVLLHRPDRTAATPELLLFPDRLRGLQPALETFVHAAFARNHYQETPLLRGIYFCSARTQQKRGQATFSSGSGADVAEEPPAGAGRGLFLHDFFDKVLPRDRGLWAPGAQAVQRQRLVQNAALVAWTLIGVSLCVMLTASFLKNMTVFRDVSVLVAKAPELKGQPTSDLAALQRLSVMIQGVEQRNRNWRVPRFGLNRSLAVEEALKARYCRDFRDNFLVLFDRNLAATVGNFSRNTPDHIYGSYLMHLIRRCNLLKGRLDGDRPASLASRPLPDAPLLVLRDDQAPFGTLYLNYLAWRADGGPLGEELKRLQLLLKQALPMRESGLGWLLEFVNRQHSQGWVRLHQFWSGSRQLPTEPAIAPAFTRAGQQQIVLLLAELSAAYPEPGFLERDKAEFLAWYRNASFSVWHNFAWELHKGEERLVAPKEWRTAATHMVDGTGPYFSFMAKAVAELEPLSSRDQLPSWIMQMHRFQSLLAAGNASGVAASPPAPGRERSDTAGRLAGGEGTGPTGPSPDQAAREYLNTMAQVAPVARSRGLAYQMAREAFSQSGDLGKSPLFQAADAAQRLNALLVQGENDDTFLRLISGPIAFYGTFIRMETACALQRQWEEKVLKEVQGASDPHTLQFLLGMDGPVWKYVGDSAEPFLGWSPGRGYYAKSALGGSIPFRTEFYSFLAKGAKAKVAAAAPAKTTYQVTIKGLPTDANREATVKPQGTRLELQCLTGSQVMANLNYPVSKAFLWSPEACGEVLLRIDVGDTVLARRYPGPRGFADFLRDFGGGRRTFHPGEFPAERQALERMGIRFIRVNYQMFGAQEIASGEAAQLPDRVPTTIAECWD